MSTLKTQNGWTVIESATDPRLHVWVIPASNGTIRVRLHRGAAGFLLAHFIMWFAETIQPVLGRIADDWGWCALRAVREGSDISNHCGGLAVDLNATQHPLGARGTFARWQYVKLRARLLLYVGCIRSGIDYVNRADEMHNEINRGPRACKAVARTLARSPRGKKILHANPGQRELIAA